MVLITFSPDPVELHASDLPHSEKKSWEQRADHVFEWKFCMLQSSPGTVNC